jgi:glutathione S-transferase
MKLYCHPASTTSRTILLFIAEAKIDVQVQVVDLFTGEHVAAPYTALNPNQLVPVLEDGDFRLTESSAILKYLAEKAMSPAYPKDLKDRARVNERMDWFNTQLGRDFAYGFVYPQTFPGHKREAAQVQQGVLDWHKGRACKWLSVLDQNIIGKNKFVCGDRITIADYMGAEMVALGEQLVRADYSAYPNVQRWLATMKALPSWKDVNSVIEGYGASLSAQPMEKLQA